MKRESSILGKVVQVNPFFACCNFSPTYNVHMKGKTVSRIRWQKDRFKSCMFSDDFQVYSTVPHRKGLVGSISRQTKAICLEDYNQADTYALSFQDSQMDRIQKTLLIAAVIMLVSLIYVFLSLISWLSLFAKALCTATAYHSLQSYLLKSHEVIGFFSSFNFFLLSPQDFQFFEGREGSDVWKVVVCCLLVVLVALLVAGIVIYLVSESAK